MVSNAEIYLQLAMASIILCVVWHFQKLKCGLGDSLKDLLGELWDYLKDAGGKDDTITMITFLPAEGFQDLLLINLGGMHVQDVDENGHEIMLITIVLREKADTHMLNQLTFLARAV